MELTPIQLTALILYFVVWALIAYGLEVRMKAPLKTSLILSAIWPLVVVRILVRPVWKLLFARWRVVYEQENGYYIEQRKHLLSKWKRSHSGLYSTKEVAINAVSIIKEMKKKPKKKTVWKG